MYAHLHELQGKYIPVCFGLFTTTLHDGVSFVPWEHTKLHWDPPYYDSYSDFSNAPEASDTSHVSVPLLEKLEEPVCKPPTDDVADSSMEVLV